MITLTQINRYPVKSTRGEALTRSSVSPFGLPFDRAWMVADASGRMVTGRTDPKLVLITATASAETLNLAAPGRADVTVPAASFDQAAPASVWHDDFTARVGASAADQWLSEFLGRPVKLLFIGDSAERRMRSRPQQALSFADAYPLLLIGQGSLDELNRRTAGDYSMQRFRPNLVVSGSEAFAEDGWKKIRIGELVLTLEKPCTRCVFITVDPHTGKKSDDQEPLRTLATFRKTPEGVIFGQNLVAENLGQIELGMHVEILESA